jgi:hypothetical protein
MSAPSLPWFPILVALAVAVLVYAGVHMKRTRAQHRARSEERAAELLRVMREHEARSPSEAPRPAARPSAAAAAKATRQATVGRATLTPKASLLSAPQRMLYLLLRAALPDHVILANIRIADLIEPPAGQPLKPESETRIRQLLLERTDCLVCTNDLVPLAALVVYEATEQAPDERVKVDALRELGVKFLRFRAGSLPRPAEMRALVLG